MPIIQKPEKSTVGTLEALKEIVTKIYDDEEIKHYRMDEAIEDHPLSRKPTNVRSKLAYREIMKNIKPTTKYLLPGQICMFHYSEPKLKEELAYYDATPMTFFFGLVRTKDGNIREIGINLHYYPPFTRKQILNTCYEIYKTYFQKQFNEEYHKPNKFISWNQLKHIFSKNKKLAFGVKMYIPTLRGLTWVLPTRLVSTGCHTEGHFSKATLHQIYHFWRQF